MPPSNTLTRSLFLRALGLVFLCAFASLSVQVDGLIGSHGIRPAAQLFVLAREQVRFSDLPSLLWLGASDGALHALCWSGALLSVLLVAGLAPRAVLLLLWALYLSALNAADVFLQFQWDVLLVETAVLAALYAPGTLRLGGDSPQPEHRGALWLLRLLLFRVMFSSGLVKLASGDPAWRDLTAMRYHYWTQPLPTPLSAPAHFVPDAVHAVETGAVLFIELVLPFLVFAPRRLRLLAFVPLAGLQVLILATGNYGFFNLLALALCLTLLDDALLLRLFPRLRQAPPASSTRGWHRGVAALPVAAFLLLGLSELAVRVGAGALLPEPALLGLDRARRYGLVGSYGLFAVMTKSRPEILLEGSADGATWQPYVFRYKPGPPEVPPQFIPGHLPRLDWMMWFAALGDCESSPWLLSLQEELLRGGSGAAALFARDPFAHGAPRYLRTTTWQYRFSTPREREAGAPFWTRSEEGPYCPPLTWVDGELRRAPL